MKTVYWLGSNSSFVVRSGIISDKSKLLPRLSTRFSFLPVHILCRLDVTHWNGLTSPLLPGTGAAMMKVGDRYRSKSLWVIVSVALPTVVAIDVMTRYAEMSGFSLEKLCVCVWRGGGCAPPTSLHSGRPPALPKGKTPTIAMISLNTLCLFVNVSL